MAQSRESPGAVQVQTSRVQRTALLDLLQEHLSNNVVTCQGSFMCQTQGIPQVSWLRSGASWSWAMFRGSTCLFRLQASSCWVKSDAGPTGAHMVTIMPPVMQVDVRHAADHLDLALHHFAHQGVLGRSAAFRACQSAQGESSAT